MTVTNINQFGNVVGGYHDTKVHSSPLKVMMKWWSVQFKVLVAEFVSTMLLLFLGCMASIPLEDFAVQPPMYSSLGFGLVILFNITTFGHISGAHMNPSVTLSAVIWGNLSIPLGIAYVIAQCGGAIAGYGLLLVVSPIDLIPGCVCTTTPHPNQAIYQALVTESMLSLALGFINCSIWDPINEEKVDGIPIKISLTIAALSLAGGPLTGCSVNPARSLAPSLWTGNWTLHWVYWAGPMIGGALAPIIYKLFWLKKNKFINISVL